MESEQEVSYVPPPQMPTGPERTEAPMPPPGGYAPPFPPPMFAPQPPRASGATAAFKWGAIFGVVAGLVNLVQVLVGAAVVNANLDSINGYENSPGFQQYLQCIQAGGTGCQTPAGGDASGIGAVVLAFYGSCFVIFLLTLVVYLFAARFGAKEAGRRGPGIWAAVIAATVGSVLYCIFGIIAIGITGRTGLLAGLGPFSPLIDSGSWTHALDIYTLIADVLGLLIAAGAAALMGLGGAAWGMRGLPPAGYMMPPPGMPPFAPPPSPYGPPPPMYAPYPPPGGQPGVPASPNYALPAQYPPLPSQYETPAAGGAPEGGASGAAGTTGGTGATDSTGNPGNL